MLGRIPNYNVGEVLSNNSTSSRAGWLGKEVAD
jgi:hypothetical protein